MKIEVGDWVRVKQGRWAGCTGFVRRINELKRMSEVEFIYDDEFCWFYNYKLELFNEKRNTMEITQYTRKPFPVDAVEVTLANIDEVAQWCKGTIEQEPTRILGTETLLPVIKINGQGENRGKVFTATLGCYIVDLKGSYRVYKPAQFDASFDKVSTDEEQNLPSNSSCTICNPVSQKEYLADSLLEAGASSREL